MPSGLVNAIVRRTASLRFCWPWTTFAHVGASESSKSAMKTQAPELSALIIILRSTGPVISTQRFWRSDGAGATFQCGVAHGLRVRQKGRKLAGVEPLLALGAAREELLPPRIERAVKTRDELERFLREDRVRRLRRARQDLDAVHQISSEARNYGGEAPPSGLLDGM